MVTDENRSGEGDAFATPHEDQGERAEVAPAADAAVLPVVDVALTAPAPVEPAPVGAEASTAEASTAEASTAEASTAEASTAEASSDDADASGEAEGEGGEAAGAEGAGAEGAGAEATPSLEGKKKRRRRRRRKKKADDGAAATTPGDGSEKAAEAGDGSVAEGSDAAACAPAASAPAEGAPDRPSAEGKRRKRPRRRKGEGDGDDHGPSEDKPKRKSKLERDKPAFNVGDEVFGRVSNVTRWAIWLDVAGGKAQGLYDRNELIQVPPRPGEQFIAKVKSLSSRGGMLMLGREVWDTGASRSELRAALETGNTLDFWVTAVIRGGLEVDYKGVRCFAPASHVDRRQNADLTPLLGEPMAFVVTHYGKKGRDVVVSRKQMIEEEYQKSRGVELAKLQPEMEVKAVVRTVLQWGAFVSLPEYGGIEGVVHMTEASHDRSARLSDVFDVGAEISVKVLKVDEKGKLWLSHKATIEDPWAKATEKYAAGSRHRAIVVRLTEFGAFIQLEPGIDGLCHIADLSFAPIEHPKDVVNVGDEMDVIVANIDSKTKKITLHPAPPDDEKDAPRVKRLALHQVVQVVVMQIRESGLAVRIIGATGRNARGYIAAGQTGTPRGTDLRKTFPLGHKMEAKVIDVDSRRGEAKLSIRAVKDDAEKQAYRDYRKKVQREATFGTFADLLKGKI